MSEATEEREPTPREALEQTIWTIIRNAYCRAATGGAMPAREAEKTAAIAHFRSELEIDYRALLACIDRAGAIEYERLAGAVPPPPDERVLEVDDS